jgi:hypothetical protein
VSNSFKLTGDLRGNLDGLDERIKGAVLASAQYVAPQAEAYMKSGAKWTDRTGAARNGLGATVQTNGDTVAIVLFHSVHYGVYLEVRWGGRYAIIEPAVGAMAPLFVQTIARLAFND